MIAMQNQQMAMLGSVPQMAPVPGVSTYPPQFTYAPSRHDTFQTGIGLGGGMFNAVGPGGGGLASAAGTAQMAGMIGGGVASLAGMGRLSRGLGMVSNSAVLGGLTRLDPMNSMILGGMGAVGATYTAGAAGGAGIVGGLGALASAEGLSAVGAGMLGTAGLMNPIALTGMAVTPFLKMMHQGGQQYSQTRQMLNAYNTAANPMSSTGRGFSSQQAADMTSMMRGINAADPFTNWNDVSSIMQRFNEFGMNQGSKDTAELGRRFKQMTGAVKDIAKTMQTSIEEASKMYGELRSAGFYRGTDIVGNVSMMKMMQGQGVSGRMMLGAQLQGGGITRMAGLGTTPGAKAVGSMAGLLAGARTLGNISSEEMMNATGAASPEEALTQYATQMSGGMTQFLTQSSVGSALTAALGSVNARGEFTGGLDEERMTALRTGQIDINNLVQSGRKRLTTRNSQLSFRTKGADVAGEMLGQDPAEAFGIIMQSIAGDKFSQMDPENLIALLTERMTGLDRKTAESMVKIVREGARTRAETTALLNREAQQRVYEVDVAQNRTISGIKTKILGGMADRVVRPLEEVGQGVVQGFGEDYQRFIESLPYMKTTRVGSDEELRRQAILDEYRGSATVGVSTGSGLGVSGALVKGGLSQAQADAEQAALLSGKAMSAGALSALDAQRPGDAFLLQFETMIDSGALDKAIMAKGADAVFKGADATAVNMNAGAGPAGLLGVAMSSLGFGGNTMEEYAKLGPNERAALAAALSKGGYKDLAQKVAAVGTGSSEEEMRAAKEKVIEQTATMLGAGAGGGFDITDYGKAETEIEKLMSSGGMGVVAQMSGSFDRSKFDAAMVEAAKTTGGGAEGRAEAMRKLGAKGTDAELAAAAEFFSKTRGSDYGFIGKSFTGMQGGLDYLNIATSLAAGATGLKSTDVGADEFRALAAAADTTAGGGDIRNYQIALEKFYGKLEDEGVGAGKASTMYGTYGKDVGAILGRRSAIRRKSTISELESDLGITKEQLAAMGIDLSDDQLTGGELESIAKQDTRAQTRILKQSAGAILSETTEQTQVALASEYAKLAQSTEALAGTVLQIQHDQQAKDSSTQTAVPSPDGN